MARVSVLTTGGMRIIVCDYSRLKTNKEIIAVMQEARVVMSGEQQGSILFLCDITDLRFDTQTKDIFVKFAIENRKSVRRSAVIGLTPVTTVMLNAVIKLSARSNIRPFTGKDLAIQWLVQK